MLVILFHLSLCIKLKVKCFFTIYNQCQGRSLPLLPECLQNAVMGDSPTTPSRIMVCGDHYRLSDDYWNWKDTGKHPSSIFSFSLTLTWIMSYIKSWQNAAPTLSAVGLSSQGAQTADRDIILLRNACRAHILREVLPLYHDVLWLKGWTGSLWLDIVPKDHSGINYPGRNCLGIIWEGNKGSNPTLCSEAQCA